MTSLLSFLLWSLAWTDRGLQQKALSSHQETRLDAYAALAQQDPSTLPLVVNDRCEDTQVQVVTVYDGQGDECTPLLHKSLVIGFAAKREELSKCGDDAPVACRSVVRFNLGAQVGACCHAFYSADRCGDFEDEANTLNATAAEPRILFVDACGGRVGYQDSKGTITELNLKRPAL